MVRKTNKIKKLITITLTLMAFVVLGHGCTKPEADESLLYGFITDFATGKPIKNANVQLRPSGETTLTGSDGKYEFHDLSEGEYYITVSKSEYTDLVDDYQIILKKGEKIRRDLRIEKIPTWILITDMMGNELTCLDFGTNENFNAFNIFNNGTVSVQCHLEYNCDWIASVSTIPEQLSPGQNVTVTIQIDRSKLNAGENTTYFHVTSNNGSNMLMIKATGEYKSPEVVTQPVTYIDGTITPWCNTFHAEVTEVGNPPYYQRGFCFSSQNSSPTINDNCIIVSGTGLGEYSYTYWDFPPNTITYYVRAWVKYDNGKMKYGNTKSFTYNNVK